MSAFRMIWCSAAVATLVASASPASSQEAVAGHAAAGKLPEQIVQAFDRLYGGPHAGERAIHAKGLVAVGLFTPAPAAASLTRAVHLNNGPVPVLVRFSAFNGVPTVADTARGASPCGMSIRFLLPDGGETDIVSQAYNGFPVATPAEFLSYLRAAAVPGAMADFAATRPAVRAFLDAPRLPPASYGTEAYFGVNAFRFTNASGEARYGRYQILPVAGESHLTAEEASGRGPDFLAEDLSRRLAGGPIGFRLVVQLAGEGDAVNDGSVPWPALRPTIVIGTLALQGLAPDQASLARDLRFTPTNLVGGIGPSEDPMLLARTQAYRVSADRRSDTQ